LPSCWAFRAAEARGVSKAKRVRPSERNRRNLEEAMAMSDSSADWQAFDCRTVTAEAMGDYVGAIPDDGQRLAPTDTFCNRGSRFVGFDLFEHRDEPTLITVWFATSIDPDEEDGVWRRDGRIVPRLEIFTPDGDINISDPSPAFMAVPMADWLRFDQVAVFEAVPGQHDEFQDICLDMWKGFLARACADGGGRTRTRRHLP